MTEERMPAKVRLTDGLGLAQDRAAFEILVLQLTGRDMAYHDRNGTTGLDTAWLCYRAGVAAERKRTLMSRVERRPNALRSAD